MTPEQRAEKIVDRHRGKAGWTREDSIKDLASQIREAVEEARHCCFAEDSPCNQKALAVWNIKAEAYEDAAKIADQYAAINRETGQSNLSERIRARAKELK